MEEVNSNETSLISVDVKNLGACNYATERGLYSVGGIVSPDTNSLQVVEQVGTASNNYTFNFCEAALPTPAGCP
jgi:hypothetical protein